MRNDPEEFIAETRAKPVPKESEYLPQRRKGAKKANCHFDRREKSFSDLERSNPAHGELVEPCELRVSAVIFSPSLVSLVANSV
jgi:hypothetical protein